MTENGPTKRCGRCRSDLPLTAFGVRRASADGLQGYCRECISAWAREHRPRKLKTPPQVGPCQKWCRRCDTTKPVTEFAANRSARDGLQGQCRQCAAEAYRVKRVAAGEVVAPLNVAAGHKFCRSCGKTKPWADWSKNKRASDGLQTRCKECTSAAGRRDHLKNSYGMTVADLDVMLVAQHGVCAICQTAPAIHVDHDHQTDKVRGLLCFRCNAALGQLGDDPLVLRRAARYVESGGFRAAPAHPVDIATEPQGEEPSVMERLFRARLADADFGTAS